MLLGGDCATKPYDSINYDDVPLSEAPVTTSAQLPNNMLHPEVPREALNDSGVPSASLLRQDSPETIESLREENNQLHALVDSLTTQNQQLREELLILRHQLRQRNVQSSA